MHAQFEINCYFLLDFDILYKRYLRFSEECKKLQLDDRTRRQQRYLSKQFRDKRANLRFQISESSDVPSDNAGS